MTKRFEKQMKAQGFAICSHCGFWCNDVKVCVRNHPYDDHPVNVALCTDCQGHLDLHPEP